MDAFVRYYDPVAGRFLSEDPVLTDADTGNGFNRYAYAANNPYKYVDPDGRLIWFAPILVPMAAGALIGGAINAADQYFSTGHVQWGGLGGVADAAGDGALFGMAGGVAAGAKGGAVGAAPIVVTEASISNALKGSKMQTTQESISLPMVKDYVKKLENGETPGPIKVDGKIIVDGNHRFVAGELSGKPAPRTEGTVAPSQAAKAKPIEKIKISEKDFREPNK